MLVFPFFPARCGIMFDKSNGKSRSEEETTSAFRVCCAILVFYILNEKKNYKRKQWRFLYKASSRLYEDSILLLQRALYYIEKSSSRTNGDQMPCRSTSSSSSRCRSSFVFLCREYTFPIVYNRAYFYDYLFFIY